MKLSEGMRRAIEAYHPCCDGIHIYGIAPDENGFVTVANFPMSPGVAERIFDDLAARFGEPDKSHYDVVADLQIDGDCCRDFTMLRQMIEPMARYVRALSAPGQSGPTPAGQQHE